MKKLLSVLLLALVTVTVSAQKGRDIYNRYSDEKDVSAVYISKSMFRLMGKLPAVELNDEDINLTELVKSLDGFYLIDCSNPNVRQNLKDDVNKFVKSFKYEMLMEVKDDGAETVRFYVISKDDDVEGLVILIDNEDSCTFICLDGKMSRDTLEKALSSID